MSEHTELPWEAHHFDGNGTQKSGQIKRKNEPIYNIAICRNLEDAQFIVTACNSYYALLEALRKSCVEIVKVIDSMQGKGLFYSTNQLLRLIEHIEAAIAGASHDR